MLDRRTSDGHALQVIEPWALSTRHRWPAKSTAGDGPGSRAGSRWPCWAPRWASASWRTR